MRSEPSWPSHVCKFPPINIAALGIKCPMKHELWGAHSNHNNDI
jgi:hypothetical protein